MLEEDFTHKNSKLTYQYMMENLKQVEGKKFDINFKLQTVVGNYADWSPHAQTWSFIYSHSSDWMHEGKED